MFAGSVRSASVRRIAVSAALALVASLSVGVGSAAAAVPGAPTSVTVTPGNQQATVSFAAPSSNGGKAITDYRVQYRLGNSGGYTTWSHPVSASTLSYTITGLTNGSTYNFIVNAVNADGNGSSSSAVAVTVGAPVAPVFSVNHPVPNQAVVNIAAPEDNGSAITDYKVEYRTTSSAPTGAWTNFAHTATTNTTFTISSLSNVISYQFRVSAINNRGTGPASATVSSTTCNSSSVPGTPGLVLEAGNQQIFVSPSNVRDSNSCDATDYEVNYRVAGSGSSFTTWSHDASTPLPYIVTGLAIGTLYEFSVKAINNAGSSVVAKTDSARTFVAPFAPTISTFVRGNGEATVTFTDSDNTDNGINDYLVEYKASLSNTWLTWEHAASATEMSYTITGLTNGVSYDVRVSAINDIGTSNPSVASTTKLFVVTYDVTGDYNDPADTTDATVTGCNGECPSNLVIPATFDLHNTVAIAPYAFDGETAITSVTIPEGVTTIGYKAFWGASAEPGSSVTTGGLTSVTLPSTLVTVGGYAFASQPNLTSISLPNTVTTIGAYAFRHNTGLTSVNLGTGLQNTVHPDTGAVIPALGRWAFHNCTSLTSITIPSGVTSIEQATFFGATNLSSVSLPNGITNIGRYAFSGTALISLTLPSSVTTIDNSAFRGMPALTSLTVGANVATVGYFAFGDNPYLTVQFQGNLPATFATNAFSRRVSGSVALNTPRVYDVPSTMVIRRSANATGWPSSFGGRSVSTIS